MLGFPLADPIVGLLISAAILVLLWGTVRSIGRRLMDGIEPDLIDAAQEALEGTPGVLAVPRLQLRWSGHRLLGAATLVVADDINLVMAEQTIQKAGHRLRHVLPHVEDLVLTPATATDPGHTLITPTRD